MKDEIKPDLKRTQKDHREQLLWMVEKFYSEEEVKKMMDYMSLEEKAAFYIKILPFITPRLSAVAVEEKEEKVIRVEGIPTKDLKKLLLDE